MGKPDAPWQPRPRAGDCSDHLPASDGAKQTLASLPARRTGLRSGVKRSILGAETVLTRVSRNLPASRGNVVALALPLDPALRWTKYAVPAAAPIALAQTLVEGPSWEMAPAYVLTGALVLVLLWSIPSAGGRTSPAETNRLVFPRSSTPRRRRRSPRTSRSPPGSASLPNSRMLSCSVSETAISTAKRSGSTAVRGSEPRREVGALVVSRPALRSRVQNLPCSR